MIVTWPYTFSSAVVPPPTSNQIRFDAVAPVDITRVWVPFENADGVDVYRGLLGLALGTRAYVQDKNDHTRFVEVVTTAAAIDRGSYAELPVSYVGHANALNNNQAVVMLLEAHAPDQPSGGGAPPYLLAPVYGDLWDEGVRWYTRVTVEPVDLALPLAFVRDQVLKVTGGDAEDEYLTTVIKAGTRAAEHATHRSVMPQTIALVLSGFPSGAIEMPRPPTQAIVSIETLDELGAATAIDPARYVFVPGGNYQPSTIRPVGGWPSVSGPVVVTARAGYVEPSAELDLIRHGIGVWIGEAYKQRSLSVEGTSVTPSVLSLRDFWRPWR